LALALCSAGGSTHTESNKLYRKVKHRYRPNLSPRQRPTAKARHDQAAPAASAEAQGATHRARPRSPSHSHSGIDEKRPTEKCVYNIFIYSEAIVHESTILSPPRPPALPTLVQYYCTIIGQYTTPPPKFSL